ncbi:MAG: hypothetical protein GVY12_02450 [Bacteroidetes bacterium]|jgi:hypothetical protein|nr:hypothetical protein [Bacteroidota bacterium]
MKTGLAGYFRSLGGPIASRFACQKVSEQQAPVNGGTQAQPHLRSSGDTTQ